MFLKKFAKFCLVLVILFFSAMIIGLIVMGLWNWLVPQIFPGLVDRHMIVSSITWLQGWGICLLGGCLSGVGLKSDSK